MNRRTLLKTAFAGATISMLRPELQAQAPAGGWPIKPLPFDPKKLKGLSEKLIVSHHDITTRAPRAGSDQFSRCWRACPTMHQDSRSRG